MENLDQMIAKNFIEDSHEFNCSAYMNKIMQNVYFFSPKEFILFLANQLRVNNFNLIKINFNVRKYIKNLMKKNLQKFILFSRV